MKIARIIIVLSVLVVISFLSGCNFNKTASQLPVHEPRNEHRVDVENYASDYVGHYVINQIREYYIADSDDVTDAVGDYFVDNMLFGRMRKLVAKSSDILYEPPIKNVLKENIKVDNRTYSYYVHLPKSYDVNKQYPLLIGLPGSSGSEGVVKCTYGRLWEDVDAERPMIKVMPIANNDTFLSTAKYVVIPILMKVFAKYNIDRDKVYIGGTSNGGVAAYYIVTRSPHLWAGCMGVPGGFLHMDDTVAGFKNAKYNRYYLGVGEFDGVSWFRRYEMMQKLAEQYNVKLELNVFKKQGHFFNREFDESQLINWFLEGKRSDLPTEVYAEFDDGHFNNRYWVSVDDYEMPAMLTSSADRGLNLIVINSTGVNKVTVYLNDKLVDLNRNLIIKYNDVIVYNNVLPKTNETLLRSARYSFQTGYNFTNCITLSKGGVLL